MACWRVKQSHRIANAANAGTVIAANGQSATQIENAPVANAIAAENAANGVTAEHDRGDRKPVASVAAVVALDFLGVPLEVRVAPVGSVAHPVARLVFSGCYRSWPRSTLTAMAKSPPRKSKTHRPHSKNWTKTRTES